MWAHGLRVHSPSWRGKARWQKREAAAHIHPQPGSRERDGRWSSAHFLLESVQNPSPWDGAAHIQDESSYFS